MATADTCPPDVSRGPGRRELEHEEPCQLETLSQEEKKAMRRRQKEKKRHAQQVACAQNLVSAAGPEGLKKTACGIHDNSDSECDEHDHDDDNACNDMPDADSWGFEERMRDTKIAIIGNVDSGKSTLVGVLTKGVLDDGRGKARSKVFNFSHEAANGRTSSIAQEIMGFNDTGEQVIFDRPGAQTVASRNQAWQHIMSQSSQLLTFIDLCGHEKYLKTTIFGLVGLCPDYAMIIVNANAGFQRMSREHLGIALALHIPILLVITKIDVAPENVFKENLSQLCKLLKSNAVRKQPVVVRSDNDLQEISKNHDSEKVCPIFCVSNVTGEGLDLLKTYIKKMRTRLQDSGLFKPPSAPVEFHIDGVFNVVGVGVVVSGIMRAGRATPNHQMLLGPDKNGQFKPVLIKTIHYKRVHTDTLVSGQTGSFALRSLVKKDTLKKSSFRKGMVLVDAALEPKAVWSFKAEVVILHHATTIRLGYQALVHSGIIRQAVQVKHMSCELLRTGDKAVVTFNFVYHGEYLHSGATILFREGRTKGLGRVVETMTEPAIDTREVEAAS